MNNRAGMLPKIGASLLFIAVEVITFRNTVVPAFRLSSVSHTIVAAGSQLGFMIGVAFLWFGRGRAAEHAAWSSLGAFLLIAALA